VFLSLIPLPLVSSLFPYTTLFRSWFIVELCFCNISWFKIFCAFFLVCYHANPFYIMFFFHNMIYFYFDFTIFNCIFRYMLFYCRSEEHTSELQSRFDLVCRLLLEK